MDDLFYIGVDRMVYASFFEWSGSDAIMWNWERERILS
jgi:hypothetical protein